MLNINYNTNPHVIFNIVNNKILICKLPEIDLNYLPEFFSQIKTYIEENDDLRFLVFDFIDINYIDSSIVAGFINIYKLIEKYYENHPLINIRKSNKIFIYNIHQNVLKILEMLKMNKLFIIKKDINEVFEYISNEL